MLLCSQLFGFPVLKGYEELPNAYLATETFPYHHDDVIMVVIGTKITCCDGASFILRVYVGGMFYDTKCDPR